MKTPLGDRLAGAGGVCLSNLTLPFGATKCDKEHGKI